FGLISLAPILLLALVALGYMIHDPHQAQKHARELLEQLIAHVLPGDQAHDLAHSLIVQLAPQDRLDSLMRARGPAAIVGMLSLVWAAMQIFVSSAAAMNAAYEVTEMRNWLQQRVVALGLLV